MNLRLTWLLACLAVMLLAGAATAVAGPIGFVGLVAPHLARMLVGTDYRWILPYSALLAAGLLLGPTCSAGWWQRRKKSPPASSPCCWVGRASSYWSGAFA
ncbi:hypothetical protein PBOI14_46720 [Pseudomonas sp. Boi14]|nr:hypothetical protein PBOI14_46720 [Pseudomonas sp. Boi14]